MSKPKNPPLFQPSEWTTDVPEIPVVAVTDITLRDLFAAAALAGGQVGYDGIDATDVYGSIANNVYKIADAMLAARERTPEEES